MNKAVEEFNRQLRETIRLLERENLLLERKKGTLSRIMLDEDKIIDEIKRYT